MVWETHEVREETNRSQFVSLPLRPSHLLMSKTCQDMRCPLTHPTQHAAPPQFQCSPSLDNHAGTWWFNSLCPPPPSHARASRRWIVLHFGAAFSTWSTLPLPPSHATASWSWFYVVFWCRSHRHLQQQAWGGFYGILMQSAPLPPPLHATASLRWFLYGVEMPFTPPSPPSADRSCNLMPFVHFPPHLLFWHRSCVFNLPRMQEWATTINVANATLPTSSWNLSSLQLQCLFASHIRYMLYVRSDVPTDTLIYCFLRVLFVSAKVDGSENWLNELFPDPRPPIALHSTCRFKTTPSGHCVNNEIQEVRHAIMLNPWRTLHRLKGVTVMLRYCYAPQLRKTLPNI